MATLSQVQLLDMAREVLHVCADHNLQEIIEDLTISRSAEATINRIFDGQFLRKSTPEPEADLPNPSELFRSSPEPSRLVSPRSRTAASRSQTTPTPAPKPTPKKSSSSVVVILSSDEEDNSTMARNFKGIDDDSDDDGFDQLMRNINLIKKGEAATTKHTNGASSSGPSAAIKSSASLPLSPRKRTALSPPPLFVDYGRSLPIERTPLSTPTATKPSPTATWTNGLKPRSADTTPTKTRAEALAADFTDKMPLSYEICSEWDAPLLPESPSPPSKPKGTTPSMSTAARNRSRSPVVKTRSPSPTPPYSPSKREWALSRSPSPGFMLRLSNNDSSHVGTSSSSTLISKYRSPSPSSIRRPTSRTHDKNTMSLPTEDDLLPRNRDREFNATSPVSRYSDETWLKRVKAEKQTDRSRNAQSERESFLIKDDSDDEDVFGVKKEEFKRNTSRTATPRAADIFDDDDDDNYKVKQDGFKRSTSRTTAARVTDVFDDAGSNEWSKYESLVDDTLSPPRTFQDDDDDDPLRALDADGDVWSKDKKRSRNNAGLPQSPVTKDLKKSKPTPMSPMKRGTRSGAGGGASSFALVPGIDHFDLSALDDYRDDLIVLDDDGTADVSVEQELVRRRTRQQRQGKGKVKDGSDLEFDDKNSDGEDGSDTGAPKKRGAKGKANAAAKAKRELEKAAKDAEKAENEAKRLLKNAEKAKAKAEKDAQKEIEKYEREARAAEREARAAERKAMSAAKKKELEKNKKERAEERQARADDADAAKQAEREFRISNRLMSKSESVKEIILCIEESMFDSELGKALQVYLKSIDCHIDLLKSPVNGAIAVATAAAAANAAAAAASTSRERGEMAAVSESTSLSELNGTNDACPVRDMIFWRRIVKARMDDQGNNVPLPEDEHTVELESHWLCYMTAKEFCKKIEQNELHKFLDSVSKDMRTRMSRQKAKQEAMGLTPPTNDDRARRQRVILMIMGLTDHFRGLKNMTTKQFQEAVRARIDAGNGIGGSDLSGIARASAGGVSGLKQERVEKVLLDLQLEEDCLLMLTEDLEESAQVIVSLTEQLGQRPYKTGRNTGLNIHMVTPNMAEGIAAEYPTIRALYEGYRRCSNVYDAQGMLEGVRVHTKKIGRVISKRIHDAFMGEDPDAGIY
ncbi:hypothetical protein BGZ95_010865 [Linnemannia exigua]|uniref:ERCC4 domain-containing protein n=1 Tax=Linnemannia exigua TaxID=604196 RepID=A0AAD4H5N9_9FUNG|nr:hypothetical protein BGZ95_010865 [Linnemannia exigua]